MVHYLRNKYSSVHLDENGDGHSQIILFVELSTLDQRSLNQQSQLPAYALAKMFKKIGCFIITNIIIYHQN